nr:MAG: hypothetical protein ADFBMEEK_00056 [Peromyscus leucopus gammaherpesvirus]
MENIQLTGSNLTDKDFSDCLTFFEQPLSTLIDIGAGFFDDTDILDAFCLKLDRVCLGLDIAGLECLQLVHHQPTIVNSRGSTH